MHFKKSHLVFLDQKFEKKKLLFFIAEVILVPVNYYEPKGMVKQKYFFLRSNYIKSLLEPVHLIVVSA